MRSKKKTAGMKKRKKRKQSKRSKKCMAVIKFIMWWGLFSPPEYPYRNSSKGGLDKSKKRKVRFQESSAGSVHENHAGELKIEPIPETIGSNEGVFFFKLDRNAKAILSCIIGKDLLLERNWKYIQKEIITNDIIEKGEDSKFYPILEALEKDWVVQHEQTHAYDESFVEEPNEDIPVAQFVDLGSDQYKLTVLKRQREYGHIFEFVDFYEAGSK